MKRWMATGLSMMLVALVAGCGAPAGTDGDLLDDWPALAAPGVPVPKVGECWAATDAADKITPGPGMTEVECTASHAAETFHVGTFSGTMAQRATAPSGADLSDAYVDCEAQAKTFLGGDWHDGRLALRVFPPTTKQWDGDARFYRCDLVEVSDDVGTIAKRTQTVKDGLSGSKPVALTCVSVKLDSEDFIEDFVPTDCATSHNGEYVGTFASPDARPYPTDTGARRALLQPGCKALVTTFLVVSEAQFDANKQLSFAWSTASQIRWSYGDRTARCYILLEGALSTSKSLKGNGNAPI